MVSLSVMCSCCTPSYLILSVVQYPQGELDTPQSHDGIEYSILDTAVQVPLVVSHASTYPGFPFEKLPQRCDCEEPFHHCVVISTVRRQERTETDTGAEVTRVVPPPVLVISVQHVQQDGEQAECYDGYGPLYSYVYAHMRLLDGEHYKSSGFSGSNASIDALNIMAIASSGMYTA